MIISTRIWTIALAATLPLAACSREAPPPAPAVKAVAPPPAAAAGTTAGTAANPLVAENPTAAAPGALTAFADADESTGDTPFTIKLNVDVLDNTGTPPYTFVWDFGDATEFSTEKSPTHVYKIPGSFRASVLIHDSKGELDQDYVDVSVSDASVPHGLSVEQLKQQMPVGDMIGQARAAAAAKGGDGAPPPARDGEE